MTLVSWIPYTPLLILAALGAGQQDDWEEGAGTQLLQVSLSTLHKSSRARSFSEKDLVFAHVPYNFGHTVEEVAFVGSGNMQLYFAAQGIGETPTLPALTRFGLEKAIMQPEGEIWGHLNPLLQEVSNVTGCPLYFTPGKHWPKAIAEAYFADKTIFGLLRDPYERLVAFFRGSFPGYGGSYPEEYRTCDVDAAVRKMMQRYLAGDIYAEGCTFLPQAEFFDPPFGISLPVDNRWFPDSVNDVFVQHGYANMHIAPEDIFHVEGCNEVWAGDLSCDTKALVRQVYARDFDLLCKFFGHCDYDENVCLRGVPHMCPSNMSQKLATASHCT